ncbi:hypothetical protein OHB49_28930 [Streptomyces sp. NBC_01717]|uniref:hypothetical protein n=1 Tax=Streptomyces sp. NBC_01717 TaxID=2975918 RepID=UPI002E330111|nr:hypothetical protein [Streptomyces sp. NBC_01717]
MDAGWSAVIAGAAGLAGAVIGGYFAKQGVIAGAKASADAIAHQVEQQSRNEHVHWVRGERRASYGEVLRAYGEMVRTFAAHHKAVEEQQPLDELNQRSLEAWALLAIACQGTRLFGPDEAWSKACELQNRSQTVWDHQQLFAHQSQSGGGPRLAEVTTELTQARTDMVQAWNRFSQVSNQLLVEDIHARTTS